MNTHAQALDDKALNETSKTAIFLPLMQFSRDIFYRMFYVALG